MPSPQDSNASLEQQLQDALRRLHDLESVDAIRRLHARYCRAMDNKDLDGLSSVYASDAHLIVTPWQVDVRGHDAVIDFYRQFFTGPAEDDRHHCVNQIIEKHGDRYRSYAYFHATEVQGSKSIIGWGLYEDILNCENGDWKIQERRITIQVLAPIQNGWAGPNKIDY